VEWYILDDNLQRDAIIEGFESFIWTERFNSWGEFQILILSTPQTRNAFRPGIRIGMKASYRVMTIETVQDEVSDDGTKKLTITGRSIEAWLEDRVAMPALAGTGTTPKWTITDTPANIANYIFQQICVSTVLDPNDALPYYHTGTLLPAGSIAMPSAPVTIDFDIGSVYSALQLICTTYVLGFRLVKDGDTGNVYFDVYRGSDRTSAQTARPSVIFSQDLESVSKTTVLNSLAGSKNVAYVFAQNGAGKVFSPLVDSSVALDERRVLFVDANDIDLPAGAPLNAAIQQRGMQELFANLAVYMLDGEINQLQPYIYGTDYDLGDLVEERSLDGFVSTMIVTEQIFVSDDQGERSYPTLTLSTVATGGSWQAEPHGEHWADVVATVHWGDLP